jgi:hypothetical protein
VQLLCTSRGGHILQSVTAELHVERSMFQASARMAVSARAHTRRPHIHSHLAVLLLSLLATGQHTLS